MTNNTIHAAAAKALRSRKRKRIAAAVLVPILLLAAVLAAFLTSRNALAAPPSANPQDYTITTDYINVGWDWPYFVTNNQVAYCADNNKASPAPDAIPQSVSFDYSFASDPQMLAKLLFYGYGGPGSPEYDPFVVPTATAMKNRYAATTYNLHRAIHGSYYVTFASAPPLWDDIASKPYPDFELAFSPATPASTIVTLPGGVQIKRSEEITLTGGPAGNSVKIPLAPGGNYSIRKGSTLYPPGATAEIFSGERFFVEAPLGYSGTFNPGTLTGEQASKFTVITLHYADPIRQRVVTWKWDRQEIGLEVEFTSFPAELRLAASKTVNAGAPAPWAFDFGVFASDITGTQGTQLGTAQAATDSAPGILFDPIQIPATGIYYYLVKEISTGGSGWTADTTEYLVEATVADNAGTLAVTQTRVASRTNAAGAFGAWSAAYTDLELGFHNTYATAPGEAQLKAIKTVSGTGAPGTWGFVFELYASNMLGAQGLRQGSPVIATNSMPTATFDPVGLNQEGKYFFLIKETSPNINGWTADTTQYLIEITAADIAGTLTVTQRRIASRAGGEGAFGAWETYSDTAAAFHNIYAAAPTAVTLKAAKHATGGTMTAGQFSFTLSSANHDATETPTLLQTKTNAAAGTNSAVTFDAIDYTAAGTFYYLLQETSPGGGWTTDARQYHVRVHVTDTNGKLSAAAATRYREGGTGAWSAWTGYDANTSSAWPAFNNHFAGFTLKALKTTVGREMEAGQFTFELYTMNIPEGGYDLLRQTTNLMGSLNSEVHFDQIPLTGPGTTYYMLAETPPSGDGWAANTQLFLFRVVASGSPLTAEISCQVGPSNLSGIPGTWIPFSESDSATWPRFTNRYYGIVFPETGGTGTTAFTITAIALTALLFLFIVNSLRKSTRNRRKALIYGFFED